MMQHPLLHIEKITRVYNQKPVVDAISFDVKAGEVLGFLGPNGAGKTTTMRMITGFLPPSSGTAVINGIDITKDPLAAQKYMGYLPEGGPLYMEMTPYHFLCFIAHIRGLSKDFAKERIAFVAAALELEPVLHQRIETLSKGYKRRVALAQAILHDPKILILDEPTDGLDPHQKEQVHRLIKTLCQDKAILLSTHVLDEVQVLCDRVVIINHGSIVATGKPNALRPVPQGQEDIFQGHKNDLPFTQEARLSYLLHTQKPIPKTVQKKLKGITGITDVLLAGENRLSLIYEGDVFPFDACYGLVKSKHVISFQIKPSSLKEDFLAYTSSAPRA
jgi:ABC-2 type transport system ATP-binding protein